MDVHQSYYSDHFMMFVGQITVLCILNLGSVVCHLCLRRTARKKKRKRDLENDKFCIVLFIFNTKYFIESSYNLTFSNGYELWEQTCVLDRRKPCLVGRKIKCHFRGICLS